VEELTGDPTVEPRSKAGLEIKNERSSAKNSETERLRCETIQKEVS